MLGALQAKLALGLRRVAFSAGAGLSFLIGAGFMTVAGWIYLAETISAQAAALIIGAIWFALGFVLLGLASMRSAPVERHQHARRRAAPPPGSSGLAEAFIFGMEAGRGSVRRS